MNVDDLIAGGEAQMQTLISTSVQEGLRVEFKNGKMFRDGELQRSGKETLASTLSSFSNSDGGTLIIGVDCRKNAQGIDCAMMLAPICNIDRALSTITDLVGEALAPKHDGVMVTAISSLTSPGDGYLIVSCPRSDRRPHMNQFTKTYFKRAGASKFMMEHYDLEDAFKRQSMPDLMLMSEISALEWNDNEFRYEWKIAVGNVGSASARDICVRWRPAVHPGIRDFGHHHVSRAQMSFYDGFTTHSFPSDFVVHPGSPIALMSFFFTLNRRDGVLKGDALLPDGRVVLNLQLTADGCRPQGVVLELSPDQIHKACLT